MTPDTSDVRVEIPISRLRQSAAEIISAMRELPVIRTLTGGELVLVQAYMLGIVMGATDTQLCSVDGLKEMISAGMEDFQLALDVDETQAPAAP